MGDGCQFEHFRSFLFINALVLATSTSCFVVLIEVDTVFLVVATLLLTRGVLQQEDKEDLIICITNVSKRFNCLAVKVVRPSVSYA